MQEQTKITLSKTLPTQFIINACGLLQQQEFPRLEDETDASYVARYFVSRIESEVNRLKDLYKEAEVRVVKQQIEESIGDSLNRPVEVEISPVGQPEE